MVLGTNDTPVVPRVPRHFSSCPYAVNLCFTYLVNGSTTDTICAIFLILHFNSRKCSCTQVNVYFLLCVFTSQKFQQISIAFKRLITDNDVVSMSKVSSVVADSDFLGHP